MFSGGSLGERIRALGEGVFGPDQIASEFGDLVDAASPGPVQFVPMGLTDVGGAPAPSIMRLSDPCFNTSVLRVGTPHPDDYLVLTLPGKLVFPNGLGEGEPSDGHGSWIINRYAVPVDPAVAGRSAFVEHAHWTIHEDARRLGVGATILGRLIPVYEQEDIRQIFLFTGYNFGRWLWPMVGFDFVGTEAADSALSWFSECVDSLGLDVDLSSKQTAYELAGIGSGRESESEILVSLAEIYEARRAAAARLDPVVSARFDKRVLVQEVAMKTELELDQKIPLGMACLIYRQPNPLEGKMETRERADFPMVLNVLSLAPSQQQTLNAYLEHGEQKFSEAFKASRSSDSGGGFTKNA